MLNISLRIYKSAMLSQSKAANFQQFSNLCRKKNPMISTQALDLFQSCK